MSKLSECSPSETEPEDIKEPIKWPSPTPHLIRMSEENSQLGSIICIGFAIMLAILLVAYVVIKSKGCV